MILCTAKSLHAALMGLTGINEGENKLSHKKWRALQKKERRKANRQKEAQIKAEDETQTPVVTNRWQQQQEEQQEQFAARQLEEQQARERAIHNMLWLQREKKAQEEFQQKKQWEENEKKRKEEEERRIREEWEERQKKEKEEEEKRIKEAEEKKARQEALLKEATSHDKKGGDAWHNPLAPPSHGSDRGHPVCPFWAKVAACRFGDRCSRTHPRPDTSNTVLIHGMYTHFELEQNLRDEYDTDLSLEYSEGDVYEHFKEFYQDVLPEFKSIGKIIQFKVCCNYEDHLRGNVYVQFKKESEAEAAIFKFNGRWYAGRQLSCELVHVPRWKSAICGLFFCKRCPKGKNCNFMHVFRNPTSEFADADRDFENPRGSRRSRSPSYRSRRSRSPSYRSRRSRSPSYRSRRSRSPRRSRRSRSGSPHRRRNSRSPSKRSRRSRSPSYRSRRSRSPSYRSRRSRSPSYRSRRSRSPSYRSRRARSPEKYKGLRSSRYKSRSRSRSPHRSKKSKSKSPDKPKEKENASLNSLPPCSSGNDKSVSKSGLSSPQTNNKIMDELQESLPNKTSDMRKRTVTLQPQPKSDSALPDLSSIPLPNIENSMEEPSASGRTVSESKDVETEKDIKDRIKRSRSRSPKGLKSKHKKKRKKHKHHKHIDGKESPTNNGKAQRPTLTCLSDGDSDDESMDFVHDHRQIAKKDMDKFHHNQTRKRTKLDTQVNPDNDCDNTPESFAMDSDNLGGKTPPDAMDAYTSDSDH